MWTPCCQRVSNTTIVLIDDTDGNGYYMHVDTMLNYYTVVRIRELFQTIPNTTTPGWIALNYLQKTTIFRRKRQAQCSWWTLLIGNK